MFLDTNFSSNIIINSNNNNTMSEIVNNFIGKMNRI